MCGDKDKSSMARCQSTNICSLSCKAPTRVFTFPLRSSGHMNCLLSVTDLSFFFGGGGAGTHSSARTEAPFVPASTSPVQELQITCVSMPGGYSAGTESTALASLG